VTSDDPFACADAHLTATVTANGWRGEPADGTFAATAPKWGIGPVESPVRPLAPTAVNPWDWRDGSVGWGLVLADTGIGSSADRAAARDAPETLQTLVAARGPAPVLRWHPDTPEVLLRYYPGFADPERIPIGGSSRGIGPGAIPTFLMLWGSLADLPWRLQYRLNLDPRICVGRLPLTGDALDRYVACELGPWSVTTPAQATALIWATDHAPGDITRMMRMVVADQVHDRYAADTDIAVTYLTGADATGAALAGGLAQHAPDVVITTSHGFTGPTGGADLERIGWLVDAGHRETDPARILGSWKPAGAIWYAHACCGAGTVAPSEFTGLFTKGSRLDRMITEIAATGDVVAPFPMALLSAAQPLRAFVGHVEPTYDWTLYDGQSRHALTADLVDGLYTQLMLGRPIGWTMKAYHQAAGAAAAVQDQARTDVLTGKTDVDATLRPRLCYLDRRALVILGDPVAAIPSTAHGTTLT
jgi:hypothetical protein